MSTLHRHRGGTGKCRGEMHAIAQHRVDFLQKEEPVNSYVTRRQLSLAATGALAFNVCPSATALLAAVAAGNHVRFAVALRVAFQSAAWIGAEAGIFKRHGIDVVFPNLAAGGPQAAKGTVRGDWEFCHTGDVPIVQGVLQEHDPVLILTPTELHEGVLVMSRHEITKPEQLGGARTGAVAATGQLGRAMQALLQQWGVTASVVSLGSFEAIYAALGAGSVDAGYLPVDYRYRGQKQYGWNVLHGLTAGTGGVMTTRRFIAANRELVTEFVKGYVDAIHLVKTDKSTVITLLEQFLELSDRDAVEKLYAFYVPLFRSIPRPTLFTEMPKLKGIFAKQYPAVEKMQPENLIDASFVDELDRTGYIARLYAG